jgi:hypothetical protein
MARNWSGSEQAAGVTVASTGTALEDVEVQVQLGAAVLPVRPQGPGHARQAPPEAAVHRRQRGQGLGLLTGEERLRPLGQGAEQGAQQFGVKDAAGLTQRAQGGAAAAQVLLDLVQGAGLLQAAQAGEDGVEEVEEQQGGVLVVVEAAVTGTVPLAGVAVEALQQRTELGEVLVALQLGGL